MYVLLNMVIFQPAMLFTRGYVVGPDGDPLKFYRRFPDDTSTSFVSSGPHPKKSLELLYGNLTWWNFFDIESMASKLDFCFFWASP